MSEPTLKEMEAMFGPSISAHAEWTQDDKIHACEICALAHALRGWRRAVDFIASEIVSLHEDGAYCGYCGDRNASQNQVDHADTCPLWGT